MKKLLILLIIPLLLSGCYDYNELNELAIISGIGIDYEDDNFVVTYEILSTKKESESSASSSTYNVTSKGKTISEAFSNNGNNMDKVPYFEHLDIVVISEEIASNHLDEVTEFMIRSSELRNEFYMAVGESSSAKDIISNSSKEKPSSANFITGMLENSKDSTSSGYYDMFTDTISKIITDGKDAILPVISLEDEKIILSGMAIFKDFKLTNILDLDNASIVNLLNNFEYHAITLKNKCDNGYTIISIYEGEVEISPTDKDVTINAKLNARVKEDTCNMDFRDEDTYIELEKKFTKILEKQMEEVIERLKTSESNVLEIGKKYYDKTRNKYYFKWLNQDFKYQINLKINKKGLTFQVD